MPIHDWTRVDTGTFHDFHQGWTIEIRNALNRGILPTGYVAATDQRVMAYEPDISTHTRELRPRSPEDCGGLAVAEAPKRRRGSSACPSWKRKPSPAGETPVFG